MMYGKVSNKTRKELYCKAWKTPITQLAKEEGISDVAFRKRLVKLDIPLPPRGYWAKSLEKRRNIPIPPLPEVTRTLSDHVYGYSIDRINVDTLSDDQLAGNNPFLLITEDSVQTIKEFCDNFSVENQLRKPTPWLQGITNRIAEKRKEEQEYLEKNRYNPWFTPQPGCTAPFNVSKKLEKRALRILDSLDKQLYKIEGSISDNEERWYERSKSTWSLSLHVPSGTFALSIHDNAEEELCLSFSEGKNDSQPLLICKDTKEKTVEEQLGKILFELCIIAGENSNEYELKRRYADRQYEVEIWKRKMADVLQTEKEYRSALLILSDNHAEASKCRTFLTSIETMATNTNNMNDAALLKELAIWIKEYADELDPFVRKKDESGIKDIWKLSELVLANRVKQQKLLDNEPLYTEDELGL